MNFSEAGPGWRPILDSHCGKRSIFLVILRQEMKIDRADHVDIMQYERFQIVAKEPGGFSSILHLYGDCGHDELYQFSGRKPYSVCLRWRIGSRPMRLRLKPHPAHYDSFPNQDNPSVWQSSESTERSVEGAVSCPLPLKRD